MQVKLIRRWSNHPANSVVDTNDTQGQWLIDHGFGAHTNDTRSHDEIEGALQPTHVTGRPATARTRPETGVAGAAAGSPDAVHNRIEAPAAADGPKPGPPKRRRS